MHLLTTTTEEGPRFLCFNCGHAFEKHPEQVRREQLHAQLCALQDDDHAARAFHHRKAMQAIADQSTHVWMDTVGYGIPEVGFVQVMGVTFRLDPGVTLERMLSELDTWLLPQLKRDLTAALDGTAAHERKVFKDGLASGEIPTPPAHDSLWCPATPTVQELYPFGYVRHADGSVEAKAPPLVDASIKSPG